MNTGLDFRRRPRGRSKPITDAERAAIAAYKGPVTVCPDGHEVKTFEPNKFRPCYVVETGLKTRGVL